MASTRATARQPAQLSDAQRERYKRAAARAAAEMIEDGMRVGLGTGTTVAHLLPAIAERGLTKIRCAATSPETQEAALALGLRLEDLDELGGLDIAIDGADQIDPRAWLVKGGGGALTRE
jgi:ribose 5-phosphate isomerase A